MGSKVAVCTLFEGDYHLGAGALINSLAKSGFRGTIFLGVRGPKPPWFVSSPGDADTFTPIDELVIKFVPVETPLHLSHYKPEFLLSLMERGLAPDGVFYFDPDIVVKAPWTFFESWLAQGLAICGDWSFDMPEDHLFRRRWEEYAGTLGIGKKRDMRRYYNGGFIGCTSQDQPFLAIWQRLIMGLPTIGVAIDRLLPTDPLSPFYYTDQDMLNACLMLTDSRLATMPPSAMDFHSVGRVMNHATPGHKPWRKGYFMGKVRWQSRNYSDRLYGKNTSFPISLYKEQERRWIRLDQKAAGVLARLYSRPWRG